MTALLSAFVLASVLATPPAPAQCSTASAAAAPQPMFASGGVTNHVQCIADCGDLNGIVSCTGLTCNAVDQSQTCPGGPGYVTCDGNTTYCPACCTNGNIRNITTGSICSCPDGQSTPKDRYQCVNGVWEYQFSFCGGPFCPAYP